MYQYYVRFWSAGSPTKGFDLAKYVESLSKEKRLKWLNPISKGEIICTWHAPVPEEENAKSKRPSWATECERWMVFEVEHIYPEKKTVLHVSPAPPYYKK